MICVPTIRPMLIMLNKLLSLITPLSMPYFSIIPTIVHGNSGYLTLYYWYVDYLYRDSIKVCSVPELCF